MIADFDAATRRGETSMAGRAVIIIVNACIWGFAMIMSSRALSGTGGYEQIQLILGGCAAASLLVVGVGAIQKPKKQEQD